MDRSELLIEVRKYLPSGWFSNEPDPIGLSDEVFLEYARRDLEQILGLNPDHIIPYDTRNESVLELAQQVLTEDEFKEKVTQALTYALEKRPLEIIGEGGRAKAVRTLADRVEFQLPTTAIYSMKSLPHVDFEVPYDIFWETNELVKTLSADGTVKKLDELKMDSGGFLSVKYGDYNGEVLRDIKSDMIWLSIARGVVFSKLHETGNEELKETIYNINLLLNERVVPSFREKVPSYEGKLPIGINDPQMDSITISSTLLKGYTK